MTVIPRRYIYLKLSEELGYLCLPRLEACYRTAFDQSTEETKRKAVARYVSVLKEGDDLTVTVCDEAFFRCHDLAYATAEGVELAKHHLLGRLKADSVDCALLETLAGIGAGFQAEIHSKGWHEWIPARTGKRWR